MYEILACAQKVGLIDMEKFARHPPILCNMLNNSISLGPPLGVEPARGRLLQAEYDCIRVMSHSGQPSMLLLLEFDEAIT